MVNAYESRLSKKYAIAFFNIFSKNLSPDVIEHIEQATIFLRTHIEAKSILAMPVNEHIQSKLIDIFCATFELGKDIQKLLELLALNYRLHLVSDIFAHIVKAYLQAHKIEKVTVKTTLEIANEEKEIIIAFLEQNTEKRISATYEIDKKLMSGIRIQGDTFLWEYSVRKQLHNISLALMRSEGIYGN